MSIATLMSAPGTTLAEGKVVVASKVFTESRILAEIITQLVEYHTELEVVRRHGLGGTSICFTALTTGEIDVYPEYTGTGWAVVLAAR